MLHYIVWQVAAALMKNEMTSEEDLVGGEQAHIKEGKFFLFAYYVTSPTLFVSCAASGLNGAQRSFLTRAFNTANKQVATSLAGVTPQACSLVFFS